MTSQSFTAPTETVEPPKRKLNLLQVAGIVAIVSLVPIGVLLIALFRSSADEAPTQPTRVQQTLLNAGFINPQLVETAEQVTERNLREMSADIARDTYTVELGACKGVKITVDNTGVVMWRDLRMPTALQIQDNAKAWGVKHCFPEPQAAPAK